MDSLDHSSPGGQRAACRILKAQGLSIGQIATRLKLTRAQVEMFLAEEFFVPSVARAAKPTTKKAQANNSSNKKRSFYDFGLNKGLGKNQRGGDSRRDLEGLVRKEYSEVDKFQKLIFKTEVRYGRNRGKFHNPYDFNKYVGFIDRSKQYADPNLSLSRKFEMLREDYVAAPGALPIERAFELIATTTAEIASSGEGAGAIALPNKAPAIWTEAKLSGDTPPAFIQRHYGPWLGKGLTRPDIKRLDGQLYVALSNWLRKNEMPHDLDLPTLKEMNDRLVSDVRAGKRPVVGEMTAREHSRLVGAIHRRKGRNE